MTIMGLVSKSTLGLAHRQAGLVKIARQGWNGDITFVTPGQPLNREQRRALAKQQKKEAHRG